MSEIKQNIMKLEELDKQTLIRYIHELYMQERKQNNKIISLHGKIKIYKKKIKKVVMMLNKMFDNIQQPKTWNKK